jgi:hypothetical protein
MVSFDLILTFLKRLLDSSSDYTVSIYFKGGKLLDYLDLLSLGADFPTLSTPEPIEGYLSV